MSVLRTSRILFAVFLLVVCTVLWASNTFYFVLSYLQGNEKTTTIRTTYDRLLLPSALFCNRYPFTQSGLNSLGSAFNQPLVIEYLQNWLDPSMTNAPEITLQNSTFLQHAELIISQTLLGHTFKDRLDSTLAECTEIISGCSVQGNLISATDCCKNYVESYLPTLSGLCWLFNLSSTTQKTFAVYQGVRIDFRIPRTSFDPISHPGIDVYLLPSHYSALRIATELQLLTPTHLRSKMGTSLRFSKKTRSYLQRSSQCGYTAADSSKADQALSSITISWINCVVKATIASCKCVPLTVVLWVYRGDFNGQIISELNATSICTVGEYDRCARFYMETIEPKNWAAKTPNSRQQFKTDIDRCKSQYRAPCQMIEFPSSITEYPSSSNLQASTDFVTSVSYGFKSFEVEDNVQELEISLLKLINYASWNLAFWFSISLIIWFFFTTSCCRYHHLVNSQQPTKVVPGPSLVSSSTGTPVSRPDSGQNVPLVHANALPPINSTRSHDMDNAILDPRIQRLNSG